MPPALPQLALRNAAITFGGKPLFSGIDVTLGRGERVCLVGANGSGKSTILKALAGEIELDKGERFLQPGLTVGYLPQNADLSGGGSVADYVAAGAHDTDADHYRVAWVLDHVKLEGSRALSTLSGGEGRRAALARTLVSRPDLLLLDEPTNHLDLPTIEWLEEELASFAGGILMISHDRAFLRKLTSRLLWLDRGRMFERDGGFDGLRAVVRGNHRPGGGRVPPPGEAPRDRGILAAARRHRAPLAQRRPAPAPVRAAPGEGHQPEDTRPRQAGVGGRRPRRQARDRGDRHRQELPAAGRRRRSRSSTASPPASCAATASASSAPTAPARPR